MRQEFVLPRYLIMYQTFYGYHSGHSVTTYEVRGRGRGKCVGYFPNTA